MNKEEQITDYLVDIEISIEKSNPPNLLVTANCRVPTGGWQNPAELERREYVMPPADGIWEYDLKSTPPTGHTTQAEVDITGTNRWVDYDVENVKGVRIASMEKLITS